MAYTSGLDYETGLQTLTLTATGNSQGTAAPIVSRVVTVGGADGTTAVVLPAALAGMNLFVINEHTSANLPVYPASGEKIKCSAFGDAGTDNPVNVGICGLGVFACGSNGVWQAILGGTYAQNNSDFSVGTGTFSYGDLGTNVVTLAATGNDQAGAALITHELTYATDADGTKGIRLPAAIGGRWATVYNSDATNFLKIYPTSGGSVTINGGSANAAVSIAPKTIAVFRETGATNWAGQYITAQSTYTQTYSTADRTIANPTAAALTVTDGVGTNDGTIGAITDNASTIAAVQELAAMINKLITDVDDVRQGLTAVIDDLQAQRLAL